VDVARQLLLAGSGLADQQHGRTRGGGAFREGQGSSHRRALRHERPHQRPALSPLALDVGLQQLEQAALGDVARGQRMHLDGRIPGYALARAAA
jgi:hypothetical protein